MTVLPARVLLAALCGGDLSKCLERGWPQMPPPLQDLAYREVAMGGPRRVPPATHLERQLWHFPPSNFVH